MVRKFIRNVFLLTGVALFSAACGAAAPAEEPAPPIAAAPEESAADAPEMQRIVPMMSMPEATPTETPLPPLPLPTPLATPPPFENWDAPPTYPGDSTPGIFFRLKYDPRIWALTEDQFGQPALGHRQILYCVIAPATGRGMPLTVRVEHDLRTLGAIDYEISAAYESDELKFVTYVGGDFDLYTGFQITFDENAEDCLLDAETVLATLASIPESEAATIP